MRGATGDRLGIIGIWAAAKAVVLLAAAVGIWRAGGDLTWTSVIDSWSQWDTKWFASIATDGYLDPYRAIGETYRYNVAFFPGFPLTMAAGMQFGLSPTLAGLIVSTVASLFAVFAVARLTEDIGGTPKWGVVAFVAAPTALFLTAAYSEAVFCAFAFWAWWFARRQAWLWAGVLGFAAALTRANALFLMTGLAVMFLLSRPWREGLAAWLRGLPILLPIAAIAAYFAYLYALTGSWNAWRDAEADFWNRHLVDPFTSLGNTIDLVFTYTPTGEPSTRMISEILAMAVMVGLLAVILAKRWWAESTYVALTAAALGTSTIYHSVPRALVVLFPLWMLVGLWLSRHIWLRWVYVPLGLLGLAVVSLLFTQGQWIS